MQFNLVQILTESIVPMDNINHGKAISIPQPRKFQVWIPAIFQPRTMGQQPGGGEHDVTSTWTNCKSHSTGGST